MTIFNRLRILPLVVLVALLAFIVRAGYLAADIDKTVPRTAESAADEEADDATGAIAQNVAAIGPAAGDAHEEVDPHQAEGETGHADLGEPPALDEEGNGHDEVALDDLGLPSLDDAPAEKIEWQDAGDTDFAYSGVKEELYKDLVKRRQDLETRERALTTREALLEAAERELGQKTRELESLRNEIKGLLEEQSAEEEARTIQLVKIYEGMKAKDAARIFDTLDMTVLLEVLGRMSERKSSPVLAAMNPERARAVTILLAQQKRLPSGPSQ